MLHVSLHSLCYYSLLGRLNTMMTGLCDGIDCRSTMMMETLTLTLTLIFRRILLLYESLVEISTKVFLLKKDVYAVL